MKTLYERFANRPLSPHDRYLIASIIRSRTEYPVYSICLTEELLVYVDESWKILRKHSSGDSISEILRSCIAAATDLTKRTELRAKLYQLESDLLELAPEVPEKDFPMPIWIFPRAVFAIAQSFCFPKYWDWQQMRNNIEDINPDDYDAALILCVMHLSRNRGVTCTTSGNMHIEFNSLDTLEDRPDVRDYWSNQLRRLDELLGLNESHLHILLNSIWDKILKLTSPPTK